MRLVAFAVIALAATSSAAAGQTVGSASWPPPSGSRIRLEAVGLGERQTGTVVSAGEDSVVFLPGASPMRVAVRTSQISQMEIVNGTHRNVGKGALIGFLVAGGTAAIVTAATWKQTSGFDFGRGGDAAFAGGLFGLVGGVVGAIAGARSTDSWVPVSVPKR